MLPPLSRGSALLLPLAAALRDRGAGFDERQWAVDRTLRNGGAGENDTWVARLTPQPA